MTTEALDLWARAVRALASARLLLEARDPDGAASRAYYAAFHAVSALFLLEGKSFSRHSAVEAAVHRDLVRPGRAPSEIGKAYTVLFEMRTRGDYGGVLHLSDEDAAEAIRKAEGILRFVGRTGGLDRDAPEE